MAFTQEELQIIEYGKQNNKSRNEILNALANYRIENQSTNQDKTGFLDNIMQRVNERTSDVKNAFNKSIENKQNPVSTSLQTVGAGAGLINDIIFEGIKSLTPDVVEQKIGQGIQNIAQQQVINDVLQKINQWSEQHSEASANLNSILEISALVPEVKVLQKAGQLTNKVVGNAVKSTARAVDNTVDIIKPYAAKISPEIKPIKAVGQVLQGETKDIKEGVKALASLDTSNVRTFRDLSTIIDDKIKSLSKQVDLDLGIDTNKKKLKDLIISSTSQSGKVVKSNPVKTALDHLEELYTKIGDKVKQVDIKDLMNKAKKDGLTKLEINNLARSYGIEFGSKAFGKTGDALTSVNAKLYENTRKALKQLAREGITGKVAKEADSITSSLYNVRTLIRKNVEAVNKLTQKIQSRGLLEKAGYTVSKMIDTLTGNSLRGLMGGILPKGAGYKTLNALDLEKLLQKNLKIIQEAISSKSDKDIMKILNSLNK